MKLQDKLYNINTAPWLLSGNVVIQKNEKLINLNLNKEFSYGHEINRCFYSNNYIFLIKEKEVLILDATLSMFNTINVKNAEGISIFDEKNYAIWFENDEGKEYFDLYITNKLINKGDFFYGKFLNKDFSYRFRKRKDFEYFRLSNLLGTETYFEFHCKENEEIYSEIKLHKNTLFFYTKEKNKEAHSSRFWIKVLNMNNGTLIHKIEVENYGACFDEDSGRFIAIKGVNQNHQIIKRYEIVDINTGLIEKGNFKYDGDMFAVGTAIQYYDSGKLYFVDNVYSYAEQKRQAPKIGCFDIDSKTVDFFEPLKEAEGYSINSFLVNKSRIYAKSNNNILYVLEV